VRNGRANIIDTDRATAAATYTVYQDEVRWLLGVIRHKWPAAWPDDLTRVNRDKPEILQTSEESVSVNLERWNAIHVASDAVQRDLFGTPRRRYDVETTLTVRVEAKPERDNGNIADDVAFSDLVTYVQYAIDSVPVYPAVTPSAEPLGRVEYFDARIEDEQNNLSVNKDHYRTEFTVRLRGSQP